MLGDIEFPSDDKLEAPLAAGTEVTVKTRLNRDGELDIKQGNSTKTGKPWMSIPFEIIDGEHAGRWCSLMLNVDPYNRYFRSAIQTITGIDISSGAKLTEEKLVESLLGAVFEATASSNDKGFVNVEKLVARTEGSAAPAAVAIGAESGEGDDDIPF